MGLLEKKVCLITGTNRGIGKAILRTYANEGAIVYANAREEGCIDEYVEELRKQTGSSIFPLYFDVRDEAAQRQAFLTIKKQSDRLDVLVNNAGVMRDAWLGMISHSLMQEIFDVNVFAVIQMMQYAVKLMKRQNGGSIINLSSIVGVEGNAGQSVYSASKGAVTALTKTAAKELAPHHIRVNAIAPGMIDTDMFHSIGEEHEKERVDYIRMGRIGTPEDVANAALFFASDLSGYITGEILGVDGSAII